MKKILLSALLFSGLCATSLLAIGNSTSWDNGVSQNILGNNPSVDGFYTSFDWMTNDRSNPLSIGLGFDANAFVTDYRGPGAGDGAYSMGINGKVALSFKDLIGLPLVIKGGGGYGTFVVNNLSYWGPQYEASADLNIFKNAGIGVKYKVIPDIDFTSGKVNLESTIFYLNMRIF